MSFSKGKKHIHILRGYLCEIQVSGE